MPHETHSSALYTTYRTKFKTLIHVILNQMYVNKYLNT